MVNRLFIGNTIKHFDELVSTNDYAIDLLAKSRPSEGTVISTDFQTGGRGQIGSKWLASRSSNVLMSLILYPKWLWAREQFLLSQAVALAVADAATELSGISAQVKWPNDVYLQEKKIAGILIQNGLNRKHLQWSIIGIGLNVNETDFPADLPLAHSLTLATGKPLDLPTVRETLFNRLEQRYLQLKATPVAIQDEYLTKLYRYQTWHQYGRPGSRTSFRGKIVGVDAGGALQVQHESGELLSFDIKEIQFLGD